MPVRSLPAVPSFEGHDLTLTGLVDGGLLAVYIRKTDGREEVVSQAINADGWPKMAPVALASYDVGSMGGMVAARLSDGRVAVAWHSDETDLGQFVLRYQIVNPDGTPASSVFTLGTLSLGASNPAIAALANGTFAISYEQGSRLKTAFADAGGTIGQEVELSAGITGNADAASLQNGGYVTVAAANSATGGADVTAYIRKPNGEVTSTILAHITGIDSPTVTALANGNFLVVWNEADTGGNSLKGQICDASGALVGGRLLLAKAYGSDYIGNPDVEALADGGFALAFSKYDSSSYTSVFLATYSATGAAVEGPHMVTQVGKAAGPVEPSISLLSDGRYTVSSSKGVYDIYDPRPAAVNWTGTESSEQYGGTRFADKLNGGGGIDRLYGFEGSDKLGGGAGNDILFGGSGKDRLTGGAGKDAFVFNTFDARTASRNIDKITDYKVRDDSIWIDNVAFNVPGGPRHDVPGTRPVKLKKKFFTVGTGAKDKNDYLIYNKETGHLLYDADGTGIGFAKPIAKLSPGLKMTHKDFFIL